MSDEPLVNAGDIKRFFSKNIYVKGFSIFSIFILVLLLLNLIGISSSLFLLKLPGVIGTSFLVMLLIAGIISTILAYFEKYKLMFLPLLIWMLIFTIDIRTSNIAGLKDITTNDYTLGPDLDPFLYLRHAKEIVAGNYSSWDMFRGVPLGTESYASTSLMPWAIVYLYKFLSIFSNTSLIYSAIIAPVIFFALSTILFFFFMVFLTKKNEESYSNWVTASIASVIYIIAPAMLHRTVAGIPEIESLGMVFFWAAFLFIILSINSPKLYSRITYGILAGLSTGAMNWTWGGYKYIYMILLPAFFVYYLFNKNKTNIAQVYISWLIPSIILALLKFRSITPLFTSITDTAPAVFLALFILIDLFLISRILNKYSSLNSFLQSKNIPKEIASLILLIIGVFIILLIIKPAFLFSIFTSIYNRALHPFGNDRVGLTVAENKSPSFQEFLPYFGYIFWPFFFGALLAFYLGIKEFKPKYKLILFLSFTLAFLGILFSKFSSSGVLNGDSTISKLFYFGSLLIFIISAVWVYFNYLKHDKEGAENAFSHINFNLLIIITFSLLTAISIKSAIRFFFLIGSMILIPSTYILIELTRFGKASKDLTLKWIYYLISFVFILILISSFVSYTQSTKGEASQTLPGINEQQWQKAMSWVRNNTPVNSVFVHWWDYGYWVQSIGERATVVDGGHPGGFNWNHFVGRYVLTTSNPITALSFMKSHNVNYLLIDPTDIGKYGAFSSIGSDVSGNDRAAYISTFVLDEKNTKETSSSTIQVYTGQIPVDADIIYTQNGSTILLPAGKSFVIGVITETSKSGELKQPKGVFYYNGNQYQLPLKSVFANGKSFDFGSGINAQIQFVPALVQGTQGMALSQNGALLYLSEKVKDTLFTKLYLQNNADNSYPTLKLVHAEKDDIVSQVQSGFSGDVNIDLLYYPNAGIRGPIKIWEVSYSQDVPVYKELTDRETNIPGENRWGMYDYLFK
ncbi:MAG: STT3 domain-containing protein [Nanoarchaeota archaeon]